MIGALPEKDLAILGMSGRDADRIVLFRSAGWAGAVVVAWCVARLATGAALTPIWGIAFALAAAGGATHAHRALVARAATMRADMNMSLAVFFDLTNVMLAGGSGIESAILAAAAAGDGPSFDRIRMALARSQSARTSHWDGLRALGEETGVESLVDIASSAQLAGEFGARVRQTLVAKARGLRQRNLALIEHDAATRTEKLGLPLVLLFMGFILLIGYPAFVRTVSSF